MTILPEMRSNDCLTRPAKQRVCGREGVSERVSVYAQTCVFSLPLTCAAQVMRLHAEGQMKDGQVRGQVYFWSSEAAPSMKNDVPGLNN